MMPSQVFGAPIWSGFTTQGAWKGPIMFMEKTARPIAAAYLMKSLFFKGSKTVETSKSGFFSGSGSGVTIWLTISRSPASAPTDMRTPNTMSVDSLGKISRRVLARKNQTMFTIWMMDERRMKNSPRMDSGKMSAIHPHQQALEAFAKIQEIPIAAMMMTMPRWVEPPRATLNATKAMIAVRAR